MHVLIVDEKNPQRVLRLTVTTASDGALSRGDLDVEELRSEDLYELLNEAPSERTIIVRSSALKLHKPQATPATWLTGL